MIPFLLPTPLGYYLGWVCYKGVAYYSNLDLDERVAGLDHADDLASECGDVKMFSIGVLGYITFIFRDGTI